MYKESDIIHEAGDWFVIAEKTGKRKCYNVCKSGHVHAMSVCHFALDADGLSLAIAYVDYKARMAAQKAALMLLIDRPHS